MSMAEWCGKQEWNCTTHTMRMAYLGNKQLYDITSEEYEQRQSK